jgi:hypothetical protein
MKPTRIVWMSRHPPVQSQLDELQWRWPGYVLVADGRTFDGADDIAARFKAAEGDEMVIVAPWAVVRELVNRDIPLLYAEMKRVPCDSPDAEVKMQRRNGTTTCFKFTTFKRVDGVDIKLSNLPKPKENYNAEIKEVDTGTSRQVQGNHGRQAP